MNTRRPPHTHPVAAADLPVAEIAIGNAYDASEYADMETFVRGLPGVASVHLDRTRGVAHVAFDSAQTTPEELERRLAERGYRCDCHARAGSGAQPGHPHVGPTEKRDEHAAMDHDEHAGHGAAMVADLLRRFAASPSRSSSLCRCSPSRRWGP